MLETNFTLPTLPHLATAAPPGETGFSEDASQPPVSDFERLLQGFLDPSLNADPVPLLLLEGIESITDRPDIPSKKEVPDEAIGDVITPFLAWMAFPPDLSKESVLSKGSENLRPLVEARIPEILVEVEDLETPPGDTKEQAAGKAPLNLKDLDVRHFEFKTELEIVAASPSLIRIATPSEPSPDVSLIPEASLVPEVAQGETKMEAKADSGSQKFGGHQPAPPETVTPTPGFLNADSFEPAMGPAESVERVRTTIEPPPPPAVARHVAMDIGDPGSQVHVVIRERNGELAVQISANERLREDLQNAAPFLMHQLQRENPHAVTLDFSAFGSATESGGEPQQDMRRKKALKSEADFADVDETAYLPADPASDKSF